MAGFVAEIRVEIPAILPATIPIAGDSRHRIAKGFSITYLSHDTNTRASVGRHARIILK